jgi:hypothetical protein
MAAPSRFECWLSTGLLKQNSGQSEPDKLNNLIQKGKNIEHEVRQVENRVVSGEYSSE